MTDQKTKKIDQLRPSSYDGIQEYDNDLPRWWVWLFYLTGVYALAYVVGVYGFGISIPPVPHEPSGVIIAAAPSSSQAAAPGQDEAVILKAKLNDPAAISKGKDVYAGKCAPCHGSAGGGVIGPNLTDDSWIHGGSLTEIKTVIENGVPEKGMLSWKAMLSQDDIRNLVVYIRSLKGSNPPGGKAAEGTPYTGAD
jgi:cytochrome c oxidase cbb3-type subunit III